MSNESAYIQVIADGTGKKVANVSVGEPQGVDTSGNAQTDLTRYEQIVNIAAHGDLIDDPTSVLKAVLHEQQRTNELLELLLGALE